MSEGFIKEAITPIQSMHNAAMAQNYDCFCSLARLWAKQEREAHDLPFLKVECENHSRPYREGVYKDGTKWHSVGATEFWATLYLPDGTKWATHDESITR